MNYNTIIFYDYETGSKYAKTTQPIQLSAIAIHSRKLEILHGGVFNSYIQPEFNEDKCKEFGIDPISEEALSINKINKDDLKTAPVPKIVWGEFCNFVNQFNYKKSSWTSPIKAGYNNIRFDDIITERLCGGNKIYNDCEKEPYKFGPWDKEFSCQALFHPRDTIDLMSLLGTWFENDKDVRSFSMDKMRDKFGIDTSHSHNAIKDCLDGTFLLIKFLKLQRNIHSKMKDKFNKSFQEENKIIASIMKDHI